jgi:amino acid adenylation domain-containing protein
MSDRVALQVGGETLTYGVLRERALRIAATLQQRTPGGGFPLTGVFALRSPDTFAGILGTLFSGHGYVPLNRTLPVARTQRMLQNADCRSLIVDAGSEAELDAVLEGVQAPLLIVLPHREDVKPLAVRWPWHQFVGTGDLAEATAWTAPASSPDDVAYLLFTSGSTGAPKGVPVSHANATRFVDLMVERYAVTPADRFSQTFDTTFDLSVFDMFVAWNSGARVCCPPAEALLNPDRFIRDNELSVWFSVPSLGLIMKQLRALKPGRYPSLRLSLFCGEPLPVELAEAWATAAPNSQVENLYGPTELTVACTSYTWDTATSARESSQGLVPIGYPYPGMTAAIVDEDLLEVAPGEIGELVMDGPQRTAGYWRNAEATARAYVQLPGRDGLYYRTGDRVRRSAAGAPMTYVGRTDSQIKVLGYRVELGEVESRLREEPGVETAVALGWPMTSAGAAGIAAFVSGQNLDGPAIQLRLKSKLPQYAVPRTIHLISRFPQNANGKIDRDGLRKLLQATE